MYRFGRLWQHVLSKIILGDAKVLFVLLYDFMKIISLLVLLDSSTNTIEYSKSFIWLTCCWKKLNLNKDLTIHIWHNSYFGSIYVLSLQSAREILLKGKWYQYVK